MKSHKFITLLAIVFTSAITVDAHEKEATAEMYHATGAMTSSITAGIKVVNLPMVAGHESKALLTLSDANAKPVTFSDLELAHTKKIHLLIIDQPPFSRPPVRSIGRFRSLPPKANS